MFSGFSPVKIALDFHLSFIGTMFILTVYATFISYECFQKLTHPQTGKILLKASTRSSE